MQESGRRGIELAQLSNTVQPTPGHPLHRQLEANLRELIRSGEVEPGAKLPGEHELAVQLRVSRHTIRHALGVLAAEGLVRRQRGRGGGTLVASLDEVKPVIERGLGSFYAFAWEVQARGGDQRSFVMERARISATSELAERLALAPGTSLERIVRLRTADGEPLVLETSYLATALAQGLEPDDLEVGSIYDALERLHRIRVVRARETIRPINLERAVARLLGVRSGSPAFAIDRRTFADTGPIEWQESIVRGDRYLYSVELPRAVAPSRAT
jgi:GntR family transcriptional regulator, N-acetylglucosamine utilization regulator